MRAVPDAASRAAARREKRRAQILDRARDVFAERGYHETKIDDIVARADVARGTFYLYFEDKRGIFEELVDRFFARLSQSIQRIDVRDPVRSPLAQLRANLMRVFTIALDDPAMTKILLNDAAGLDAAFDRKMRAFYGALGDLIQDSLADGQKLGLVRAGDRRVLAAIGLGGLRMLLVDCVTGKLDLPPEKLTGEVMHFVARGLLAADAVVESAAHDTSRPPTPRKRRG